MADPRLYLLLVEPLKTGAEVRAASSLNRDFVGEVVGCVLGCVLRVGINLEHDDAVWPVLGRDLVHLRRELGERRRGE